jgi:hypothetical protein
MAYLDSGPARNQRRPSPLNLNSRAAPSAYTPTPTSPTSPSSTYSSNRRGSATFSVSPFDSEYLYDVPNISPPATPGVSRIKPSSSPAGRRSRDRSSSRSRIVQSDLEKFAEFCRKWCASIIQHSYPISSNPYLSVYSFSIRYFDQDSAAGQSMTQTLASVPPSQKASYTRVQAATRAAFHRSVQKRRTAAFLAHLSATQPGASLSMSARKDVRGKVAKEGKSNPLLLIATPFHFSPVPISAVSFPYPLIKINNKL